MGLWKTPRWLLSRALGNAREREATHRALHRRMAVQGIVKTRPGAQVTGQLSGHPDDIKLECGRWAELYVNLRLHPENPLIC